MTIKKKESSDQPSLFDYIKKVEKLSRQSEAVPPGSLDIRKEFKAALAEDIRHAKDDTGRALSRYEVAGKMSEFLGRQITKDILDNWTAVSHPHSIPADYLPAFKHATGGRRAHECLSRHSGLFLLPSEGALRAEIQKMDEEMKLIKQEKRKRLLYLKELSGDKG